MFAVTIPGSSNSKDQVWASVVLARIERDFRALALRLLALQTTGMHVEGRAEPAHCGVHGLVASADGNCVLCRRTQKERAAAEARALLRRLLVAFTVLAVVLFATKLGLDARRAWLNREAAAKATAMPGAGPTAAARVVVYGTAWCGACKAARAYLTSREIPFQDIDIDRDRGAFLDAVMAAHVPPGSVPIPFLHVGSAYHEGWDRAWFDGAYAEKAASNAL